jgi:hypothetical protein
MARQLESLPQPAVHHATVFDSERAEILVLGGAKETGGAAHQDVWVYSVADDQWHNSVPSLPSPRAEGSAIIADRLLYLWGSTTVRHKRCMQHFANMPCFLVALTPSLSHAARQTKIQGLRRTEKTNIMPVCDTCRV